MRTATEPKISWGVRGETLVRQDKVAGFLDLGYEGGAGVKPFFDV